jgi:hypothetical protein
VLLTDDAGQVLYIGSFLAEAFLDGSNHAVMSFDGQGAAKGASGALKGSFRLHKDGTLAGPFTGHIELPLAARRQLLQHQGAKMRPLQEILDQVTVKPSAMRGRATTPSTSVPLHTGFGQPKSKLPYSAPQSTSSSRHLSPLTIVAGIGAILSFLIAGILFWLERRRAPA